jgi:excisionase family DNA binding protein
VINSNIQVVLQPLAVDEHQAAAMLGISTRTLWDYRKSGEIPIVRIGRLVRFDVDDLKRFLAYRKEIAASDSDS